MALVQEQLIEVESQSVGRLARTCRLASFVFNASFDICQHLSHFDRDTKNKRNKEQLTILMI